MTVATLTPEQWSRVDELFSAVCEHPQDRARLLDACTDQVVRSEVESLLANADTSNAPLEGVVAAVAAQIGSDFAARNIDRKVGAYRLQKLLGEGGMGMVYAARRDDGEFVSDVAIKLLQHGLGSTQAIARFRDERQILAGLRHPHIVQLLDGGTTEDGLPYLVMELVDGMPITRYARECGLSIRARVELIVKICSGLQYAHDKLVVHRDLKPGNILVDREGMPKLLDFGIAKLLDPVAQREAQTTGAALLTPAYASPEQVRGEAVTLATDVYSIGAVLYELLAEQPPHRIGDTPLETVRSICEVDPPPPSALVRAVGADLDNIVMKTLRKAPAQRYATIRELAEDLERFLDGQPVLARPLSIGYRAGKFAQRNAGRIALVGGVGIAIASIAVAASRSGSEPEVQVECSDRLTGVWDPVVRTNAMARFAASKKPFVQETARAMLAELDKLAGKWADLQKSACSGDPKADPLLHTQRLDCLEDRLLFLRVHRDQMLTADVDALATAYDGFDGGSNNMRALVDCGNEVYLRAQPAALRDPRARSREAEARFRAYQAGTRALAGQVSWEEAERTFDASVREVEQLRAPSLAEMLGWRAYAVTNFRGDLKRGVPMLEHALEVAERSRDDEVLGILLAVRASTHMMASDDGKTPYNSEEIDRLLKRSMLALDSAGQPRNPSIGARQVAQSHAWKMERRDEALRMSRELVTLVERAMGPTSLGAAGMREVLSDFLARTGDHPGALDEARRVRAIRFAILGENHPRNTQDRTYLERLAAAGQFERAIEESKRLTAALIDLHGPRDPRVVSHLDMTGHWLTISGQLDESITVYRDVVSRAEPSNAGWVTYKLAEALGFRGHLVEGVEQLRIAEQVFVRSARTDDHDNVRGPRRHLIFELVQLGQLDEARRRLKDLSALLARDVVEVGLLSDLKNRLAVVEGYLIALGGDAARGERLVRETRQGCGTVRGVNCSDRTLLLGRILGMRGRHREHVQLLVPLLEELRKGLSDHPKDQSRLRAVLFTSTDLGIAQLAAGDGATALSTLKLPLAHADDWSGDVWVPDARFAFARATVSTDPAAAIAAAKQARDAYVALGEGKLTDVTAIDRWLRLYDR